LSDKGILIVDDFYDILLNAANMDVNDIEEEDSSSYAILRCLKHMNKEAVKHKSMAVHKRWNKFREQQQQNGKK